MAGARVVLLSIVGVVLTLLILAAAVDVIVRGPFWMGALAIAGVLLWGVIAVAVVDELIDHLHAQREQEVGHE
jgi:hypothetical protein